MSLKRLLHRVPSAEKVHTGVLDRHELKFHKVGKSDGTAKCDVSETGNPEHVVYGVVYSISSLEKPDLDRNEGLGYGYEEKLVIIRLADGSEIEAFTYTATKIDSNLKPLDWYREHVLRGARENGLPEEYVRKIESVDFDEDSNTERRYRELSIYR